MRRRGTNTPGSTAIRSPQNSPSPGRAPAGSRPPAGPRGRRARREWRPRRSAAGPRPRRRRSRRPGGGRPGTRRHGPILRDRRYGACSSRDRVSRQAGPSARSRDSRRRRAELAWPRCPATSAPCATQRRPPQQLSRCTPPRFTVRRGRSAGTSTPSQADDRASRERRWRRGRARRPAPPGARLTTGAPTKNRVGGRGRGGRTSAEPLRADPACPSSVVPAPPRHRVWRPDRHHASVPPPLRRTETPLRSVPRHYSGPRPDDDQNSDTRSTLSSEPLAVVTYSVPSGRSARPAADRSRRRTPRGRRPDHHAVGPRRHEQELLPPQRGRPRAVRRAPRRAGRNAAPLIASGERPSSTRRGRRPGSGRGRSSAPTRRSRRGSRRPGRGPSRSSRPGTRTFTSSSMSGPCSALQACPVPGWTARACTLRCP